MRQRQAVERQQHGTCCRNLENSNARRHTRDANKHARHNPADGAKHAHHRERLIDIIQAVEGNVVRERQRRHVAERIAKQQADQQRAVFSNQRARDEH
ncbi:hypothetical protein D3C80_1279660 [compost metagenome]